MRGWSQARRLDESVEPFCGAGVKTAFTLVELLVVIAVIAILAAMLLPVLSGAKLQAQQTQCINNLKQLALAHGMYADDFGKEIPNVEGYGSVNPWESMLRPYYSGSQFLPLCPSASKLPTVVSTAIGSSDEVGSADTAWYMVGFVSIFDGTGLATGSSYSVTNRGCYAFNGWLYDPWGFSGNLPGFFRKPSAVHLTSLTPVFTDSITHDVLPDPSDLPATNLYTGVGAGEETMSSITIARHGSRPASAAPTDVNITRPLSGVIDVALFDGHVEKSPLENLWNYYWTAGWQVPSPRPGR